MGGALLSYVLWQEKSWPWDCCRGRWRGAGVGNEPFRDRCLMVKLGYIAFCIAHVEVVRPVMERLGWTGIEIIVIRTPHDPTGGNVATTVAYLARHNIPYAIEPSNKYDLLMSCIILDKASRKRYAHRGTRFIRILYSAAGKNYTYGPDNGAYDLILTAGPYSEERLCQFAPCVSVGMPRFDILYSGGLAVSALKASYGLRSTRPVLLYVPTWGVESSIDQYADIIVNLIDRFEVVVKLHPLTYLREKHRLVPFRTSGIHLLNEESVLAELLAMADVVVSDYSGSLFEALAADKPLLLLDVDDQILRESRFYEGAGPEHRLRDIAPRASNPEEFESRLLEATTDAEPWPTRRRECAEQFFVYRDGNSSQKAASTIEAFIARHRRMILAGRWRSRLESGLDSLRSYCDRLSPGIGLGRCLRRLMRRGARP